ncbi:MAG: RNA repair domain-containing protein [Methanomassiliicoccales archaeon]|nr:RNA repair domain-containing protein [Methanomassiliicoccales archaeon]
MSYPREVLNEIKWGQGGLGGVTVIYLHRGALEDLACVRGEDIIELGKSFFSTADGTVPYHRIRMIEKNGKVVFRA